MTKQQALQLLHQVVELYRGTAEEHRKLAEALQVLEVSLAQEKKSQ